MINSFVSIIMPAYNSEKYISESIESVIKQTYEKWELIIINDCSTDSTKNIVECFRNNDSRIRLICNEKNQGVSYSRNIGIENSLGDWIAFLDSDDIWEPSKLEKQLNFSEIYNTQFTFTAVKYIDSNGLKFGGQFNVPLVVSFDRLKFQNYISCSSVVIKKSIIAEQRMVNDNMHEDYAFWLSILKKNIVAYGLNETLLIYRISSTSKSGNKIKSFFMTFRVFRYLRFGYFYSILYTLSHILRSVVKYTNIYKDRAKT